MNRIILSCLALLITGCAAEAATPPSATPPSAKPPTAENSTAENSTAENSEREASGAMNGFAVVELFTSQGCSSCPSADENLARIVRWAEQNQRHVYGLSYHVDYWNRLGWTDPFSQAAFSGRQRSYVRAWGDRSLYTPQMVVNGRIRFVGSRRADSDKALKYVLSGDSGVPMRIRVRHSERERQAVVDYKLTKTAPGNDLQVALVQRQGERQVDAGENRGRRLVHVNIVRDLKRVDAGDDDSGRVVFALPESLGIKDYLIIAFLQERDSLRVLGAVRGAPNGGVAAP